MMDLARQAVGISQAGAHCAWAKRGRWACADETHFLNALQDSLETGQTPADELLARYHGDWQGDLTRIYEEYSYLDPENERRIAALTGSTQALAARGFEPKRLSPFMPFRIQKEE